MTRRMPVSSESLMAPAAAKLVPATVAETTRRSRRSASSDGKVACVVASSTGAAQASGISVASTTMRPREVGSIRGRLDIRVPLPASPVETRHRCGVPDDIGLARPGPATERSLLHCRLLAQRDDVVVAAPATTTPGRGFPRPVAPAVSSAVR